jgi:hypothetical protein
MLSVFLVGVFKAKVVDNKTEGDATSFMLPETGGERYKMVPTGN